MYENTKGVKALAALLRQNLEVGEPMPPEMQAALLRLVVRESELRPVRQSLDAEQEMTEHADGDEQQAEEARVVG